MFESTRETKEFSGYIVNGNIDGVRRMASAGFDINAQIREVRSAIHLAVACSKLEMCRAVIELGADVNLQFAPAGTNGARAYSALHYAAEMHSLPKVQLLLDAGANPNATSLYGATPAHMLLQTSPVSVAPSDWLDSLRALLEAGADPNAALASQVLSHRLVQFDKLFGGADARHAGSALTVLHCAVLLSNAIDDSIAVAARLAGFHGARVIEILLPYGADPSIMPANPSKHYLTPLQMAVKFGSPEDVQVLVDSGMADALQKTVTGRSLRQLTGRPEVQAILRAERSSALVSGAVAGGAKGSGVVPQKAASTRRFEPI